MNSKNYVGFDTLEKLLESADSGRTVNAMPINDPGKMGKYGVTLVTQMILVSQAQINDEILYCRIITGHYQALPNSGMQPLDPGKDYHSRAESAWKIVQEEIGRRGFVLREALLAMPINLKFLDGYADCLHYNKETDLFERRESADAEVVA